MKLVSFPRPVARDEYARAVERVLARLRTDPAVTAIYQVGGIRSPGISDIDLLVVFRDDVPCDVDPLEGLGPDDRYLFPHSQFGLAARHLDEAVRFGFFHDYHLLWGGVSSFAPAALGREDAAAVNRQTGLEYLLKMFISMTVERTYRIARVRNLLLLGRALRYDLDYVGAPDGAAGRLVDQVTAWRDRWFESPPTDRDLVAWFDALYGALAELLPRLLDQAPLYAPEWADLRIASNMQLFPSSRFSVAHHGVALPTFLGGLDRRFFNLQHRFNRFRFGVPMTSAAPDILRERHEFVAGMLEYNRLRLPHFIPVSSALGIFRRRIAP